MSVGLRVVAAVINVAQRLVDRRPWTPSHLVGAEFSDRQCLGLALTTGPLTRSTSSAPSGRFFSSSRLETRAVPTRVVGPASLCEISGLSRVLESARQLLVDLGALS